MNIKFLKENLQNIMDDFYNVTGVRLAILDSEFNLVCNMENSPRFCSYIQSFPDNGKCLESDMKILKECSKSKCEKTHICHAGLIDIAVPILDGDTPIGYILLGQMRRDVPFEKIKINFRLKKSERETLKKYYDELTIYDDGKIKSISNLAAMLASYILSQNMIKAEFDELPEKICDYIDKNLQSKITVNVLTKQFGLSKNTLYRLFQSEFDMTVSEYITKIRIKKAKELLKDKRLSISEISDRVGMENYSYFAKVFKMKEGVTPTEYRKKYFLKKI